MNVDRKLLAVLQSVQVPQALTNCKALIEYLKRNAAAPRQSQSVEEERQRNEELLGHLIASHVELINTLGSIDQQLRTIGAKLKEK
jgi:flagellar motor switch protein FliM